MALGDVLGNAVDEAKRLPGWAWVGLAGVVLFVGHRYLSGNTVTGGTGLVDTGGGGGTGTGDGGGGGTGTGGGGTGTGTGGGGGTGTGGGGGTGTGGGTGGGGGGTKPKTKTYTVKSGDTLADIGYRFGTPWTTIYDKNANVIESTARSHGFANSDHGHWIFPGEVLVLP